MKKILWSVVLATLVPIFAFSLTDSEKYLLNNKHGNVAHQMQLGALIDADALTGGTLASASIVVGNGSGLSAAVAMSGDATIANTGALTIVAGAVDETMLAVPTADGLNARRVARATYDFTVDGGAQGAIGLGVTLPANSMITRGWFYTTTQFVDAGAGTAAISCEDANNIFSAADVTGITVGTITDTIADDTTAAFITGIAAACEITLTIATADATAGGFNLYIEYVVHD